MRPTTTKIKVEIDITRTLVSEIHIVVRNKDRDNWNLSIKSWTWECPEYCSHYKAQRHNDDNWYGWNIATWSDLKKVLT